MRCPNCGYEGESKFCPNCGIAMEKVAITTERVCTVCGEHTEANFCPNCGSNMNVAQPDAPVAMATEEPQATVMEEPQIPTAVRKKSHKKTVLVIVIAIAAVIVAAIIAFAIIVKGMTDNAEELGLSEDSDAVTSQEVEPGGVTEVEAQGKELPGGHYVVGEDIAAGKYNFTYKTEMSEDDYWSNDYFYITRAGSEGTEETLGGTKFDERFGSVDYGSAAAGKTFYANLKKGDKIVVNSEFGTWTY